MDRDSVKRLGHLVGLGQVKLGKIGLYATANTSSNFSTISQVPLNFTIANFPKHAGDIKYFGMQHYNSYSVVYIASTGLLNRKGWLPLVCLYSILCNLLWGIMGSIADALSNFSPKFNCHSMMRSEKKLLFFLSNVLLCNFAD